jgi:hypothetical protein
MNGRRMTINSMKINDTYQPMRSSCDEIKEDSEALNTVDVFLSKVISKNKGDRMRAKLFSKLNDLTSTSSSFDIIPRENILKEPDPDPNNLDTVDIYGSFNESNLLTEFSSRNSSIHGSDSTYINTGTSGTDTTTTSTTTTDTNLDISSSSFPVTNLTVGGAAGSLPIRTNNCINRRERTVSVPNRKRNTSINGSIWIDRDDYTYWDPPVSPHTSSCNNKAVEIVGTIVSSSSSGGGTDLISSSLLSSSIILNESSNSSSSCDNGSEYSLSSRGKSIESSRAKLLKSHTTHSPKFTPPHLIVSQDRQIFSLGYGQYFKKNGKDV